MIRLIGLSPGKTQPSSRFRWQQHIMALNNNGIVTNDCPSFVGSYPPSNKLLRPMWGVAALINNGWRFAKTFNYDIVFLQRNMISTLATYESYIKRPVIFDVDDAIFLGNRGYNAAKIAELSKLVICGNAYLQEYFSKYADTVLIPTAVDVERYYPKAEANCDDLIYIGWSGSSSGLKYLYGVEGAIADVLEQRSNVYLKVMCDQKPLFNKINSNRVIYEKWSISNEVDFLRGLDIGIMPLATDNWSRGKCSYKMLTYMAVGLPVIVSSVGMNRDIFRFAQCGFCVDTHAEWENSFLSLIDNPTMRQKMGAIGRKHVEDTYSKSIISEKITKSIKSVFVHHCK